jgi:hypothetical protein
VPFEALRWDSETGPNFAWGCVSTGAWSRGFWTLASTKTSEKVEIVSIPRRDFGVFCFVLCAMRRASAPTGQRGPAMVSSLSSRPVDVKIVRFDPVTSLEIQVSPLGRFLASPASYTLLQHWICNTLNLKP